MAVDSAGRVSLVRSAPWLHPQDQAVEDSEVAARRNRVQVGAVVGRLRRKVTQVNMLDLCLRLRNLKVVCRQPVPKATAAAVNLHKECFSLLATLKLDKVVRLLLTTVLCSVVGPVISAWLYTFFIRCRSERIFIPVGCPSAYALYGGIKPSLGVSVTAFSDLHEFFTATLL